MVISRILAVLYHFTVLMFYIHIYIYFTDFKELHPTSKIKMSSHVTIGNVTVDLNNYTCSYKGLLLPLVSEYTWSIGGRAFLYLLGLLWIFMAVAIIADVFMCSIERITSRTTTIRIADSEAEGGYREMEVKVWNNTVANLSLLALGTSAPEILLSVIETVGNGFKAGELGPGTIVGSAAFNLLVISGICVMSIPSPDTRRIAEIKVFFVTGFTCIFAYIWMAIVLMVSSPDEVEIWEAVVTLVFFPLLILVAYLADRNFCLGKKEEHPQGMVGFALGKLVLLGNSCNITSLSHYAENNILPYVISLHLSLWKQINKCKMPHILLGSLSDRFDQDRWMYRNTRWLLPTMVVKLKCRFPHKEAQKFIELLYSLKFYFSLTSFFSVYLSLFLSLNI